MYIYIYIYTYTCEYEPGPTVDSRTACSGLKRGSADLNKEAAPPTDPLSYFGEKVPGPGEVSEARGTCAPRLLWEANTAEGDVLTPGRAVPCERERGLFIHPTDPLSYFGEKAPGPGEVSAPRGTCAPRLLCEAKTAEGDVLAGREAVCRRGEGVFYVLYM